MKLPTILTSSLLAAVALAGALPVSGAAADTPAGAAGTAPAAAAPAALLIPDAPRVDARAYLLVDYLSGQTLAEHDADVRLPPASLTKLMTCYVVFHALRSGALKLTDPVTISEHAWRAEGSRTFLQVGSQVPAEVLIKGMIVQSGNDATIALAERVGGTEPAFVQLMNAYAQRLGMTNTHFDDSTGLPSPTHYTTARDLSRLATALIREFPEYYPWFSIREFVWDRIRQDNRNGLLGKDPSVDGMKTGHTDAAGYCLVTSARRSGMRLVAVVLGSDSVKGREGASAALLNYGFTFFDSIHVQQHGTVALRPRVYEAPENYYPVGPAADVNVAVPRGAAGSLQTTATIQGQLIAPLTTTSVVGQLQVLVGGHPVRAVPLFPLQDIPAGGLWSRLVDGIRLHLRRP